MSSLNRTGSGKRRRRSKKKLYKRKGFYVLLVSILFCIYGCAWLFGFRILPNLVVALIIELDILVLVLLWYLLLHRHRRWMKTVGYIVAVLLCLANGIFGYTMQVTWSALDKMAESAERQTGTYVELDVMESSLIENPEDLNGRIIGVLSNMDPAMKKAMTDWLESEGIQYELKEYDSSLLMARNLKGAVIDAIIIYQPYLSVVENYEGMENFSSSLRTIHQIEWEDTTMSQSDSVDVTKDPFTILVSGIDTYGEIGSAGRSDVNMLISVNPTDRSILLLSIPRDFYVSIDCDSVPGCAPDQKDKLTHSGIYGINVTEKTLERLFDTTINYDIRVNFSSVIKVVDALGGVDVNNVDTFDIGGYHFEPGTIHLDGDMALQFSRERYSFVEGDRERGRNQMRVVEGIIKKALSPQILENYTGILNAAADSIQMNLTVDDIAKLVNMQLSHPSSWNVYTYSVSGSDANDYAPALGDNAYVMIPDEAMLKNARLDLQAIKAGETPLYVTSLSSQ